MRCRPRTEEGEETMFSKDKHDLSYNFSRRYSLRSRRMDSSDITHGVKVS
jgi:hypothetical protein